MNYLSTPERSITSGTHEIPQSTLRKTPKDRKQECITKINNQGEQHLCLTPLDKSFGLKLKMQSAAVSRPILRVIRLAEHGNDVAVRNDGGTIKNLETGRITHFERKHGVYVLRVWLQTNPEGGSQRGPGFARQA